MKINHLFIFALFLMLLTGCGVINNRFLRGDVIGFSDRVEPSYYYEPGLFQVFKQQSAPYNLCTEEGQDALSISLNSISRGMNTTAYYAVEQAADRVKYIRRKVAKNDPQTKYYIFLLTDGLDNASPQVAKNDGVFWFDKTPEQYKKRLQRKLKGAMGLFAKNTFEVYPMMFEGEDIQANRERNNWTEERYQQYLQQQMECFRYSSTGEAPQLISSDNFEEIIMELRQQFLSSSYTFGVSKSQVNKQIRMNFVNEDNQKIVLTGTLHKSGFSYVLDDVKIDGGTYLTTSQYCKKGGIQLLEVQRDKYDINAYFTIEDLRIGKAPYFPLRDRVEQEIAEGGFWQINSEYQEAPWQSVDTYFVLVVDGSRSLDGKNHDQNGFENEIDMANKIVDMLLPR